MSCTHYEDYVVVDTDTLIWDGFPRNNLGCLLCGDACADARNIRKFVPHDRAQFGLEKNEMFTLWLCDVCDEPGWSDNVARKLTELRGINLDSLTAHMPDRIV